MIDQHSGLLSPWVDGMRMRKVAGYIPPNKTVLDLGCGPALILRYLPSGIRYTGVDVNQELIEKNKKKFPSHQMICSDFSRSKLPFDSETFDIIVLAAVLEHLDNFSNLLKETDRVLKSGGVVVATTPSVAGGVLHDLLSRLRLLSHDAAEEHKGFWDLAKMKTCVSDSHLEVSLYRKFQFGLNQLFVLTKKMR